MFLLWFLCGYFLSVTSLFSAHITGSFTIKVSLRQLYYLPRLCFCCVVFANGYSKMSFNHRPKVETNHGLFFFICGLCDPGKPLYLSQFHCPVCVNTCSIVWAGAGGAKNLSTPVLCALARRDWWLLAASFAGDTDRQSHKRETHSRKTLH